jgi:hypothetical protein
LDRGAFAHNFIIREFVAALRAFHRMTSRSTDALAARFLA